MKSVSSHLLSLLAAAGLFLTGCSFKRVTDSPRHFVLAAIPEQEQQTPAATRNLSIGIGFVRLPPELLQDSIAVQNGTNEFQYLENALWAERLDHNFERTIAANLSRLLNSDSIYTGNWSRDEVMLRVTIQVEKFEVDTRGNGSLVARWRIKPRENDQPPKTGVARASRVGESVRLKPEVIVDTLSGLTADFSRDLAQALRESSQKYALSDGTGGR